MTVRSCYNSRTPRRFNGTLGGKGFFLLNRQALNFKWSQRHSTGPHPTAVGIVQSLMDCGSGGKLEPSYLVAKILFNVTRYSDARKILETLPIKTSTSLDLLANCWVALGDQISALSVFEEAR
eukprot:sb/3475836/